jgi:hypothetical protein
MSQHLENIYLTEARVYIAGILMPTTQATISCTFNRPPQAEISLPAYSELLYLGERDRVPVHIFVRETMVESPRFLLLFEGFITETSYVNSALQRSIGITAVSHFDILNDVQVKFMTQLEDVYNSILDGAKDIVSFIQTNGLVFPLYLFQYGIVAGKGKEEGKPICFPSDYLENIYGYMQLAHAPKDEDTEVNGTKWTATPPLKAQHASALAEYYGKQACMLRFLDRFERLPYFDEPGSDGNYAWQTEGAKFNGLDGKTATVFPMIYGMQQEAAIGLLTQGANNAAQQQSLMELLTYLVEEMEYEYLFITNPAYHGAVKSDDKEEENADNKTNNQQTESGGESKEEKPAKLVSSCLKPLFTDTMPPACNVMYRPLVDSISMGVGHKGVPTRILVTNTYSQLERITGGAHSSFLSMYGLIDYYPSERYPKFDPDDVGKKYLKFLGTELLPEEKHTGPWVRQLHTPRWFHYLSAKDYSKQPEITLENGEKVPAAKVFKERFFRRQLLNSKYFQRQLQAQCMFDPYITPGFPGVVFDSGDSGFAFAGHVVTVVHTISPSNVSTQVAMNFVRPLHEAASIEIPNPIMSIQQVTHDKEKLGEIYQKLLGVAAEQFSDLETLAVDTSSESSPNNNPLEAYTAKRRNIVSFEDYLSFMGFGCTYGNGPEGPQTPLELTGEWLEDRYKLPVYDATVVFDPVIPDAEQNLPVEGASGAEASTASGEESGTASTQESSAEKIQNKAEEQRKARVERTYTEVDVRTLLRSIAEREFSRMVYA